MSKEKKEQPEVELPPLRAVIYTDGGAHQSLGIGAWGLHGFYYRAQEPKKGSGHPTHDPVPTGYVKKKDKSVERVTIEKYVDANGSLTHDATNNVAEIYALIKAMEIILEDKLEYAHFILDSKYVLDGLTKWIEKWRVKDWKGSSGEVVANVEHWQRLDALYGLLKEQCEEVTFDWVKGHSGEPGNEKADLHARKGLIVAKKGMNHTQIDRVDPTGYWSPKVEVSRMFGASRMFFYSNEGPLEKNDNDAYTYYLFDPPPSWDEEMFGTPEPDAAHIVLYMNEKEEVVDALRQFQRDLDAAKFNSVMSGRLDFLFRPRIYKEMVDTGDLYLYTPSWRCDVFTTDKDKTPLTTEHRPPRLAFEGMKGFYHLERILKRFIEGDDELLSVTDLTPIIYEEKKSKSKTELKIRPEFATSTKHVDVEVDVKDKAGVRKEKTRLIFGIDLPKRNVLSALSGSSPELYLVTWRQSDSVYHIASILKTEEGIGIWSNVWTNYRFTGSSKSQR